MPVRFDIKSFDKNFENEGNFDLEGFSQSKALIDDIVAREVAAGIPHNRIVLGGFSQGGSVTLFAGLQAEYSLGGLLVMSSWMPARWRFPGAEPKMLLYYNSHICINRFATQFYYSSTWSQQPACLQPLRAFQSGRPTAPWTRCFRCSLAR
jgi:pimeloyl-ACP methyl ester carboxylesterase